MHIHACMCIYKTHQAFSSLSVVCHYCMLSFILMHVDEREPTIHAVSSSVPIKQSGPLHIALRVASCDSILLYRFSSASS